MLFLFTHYTKSEKADEYDDKIVGITFSQTMLFERSLSIYSMYNVCGSGSKLSLSLPEKYE